jgi:hypothetical protein
MVLMSTHTNEHDPYAEENDQTVIGVRVRSLDEPQLVAEDLSELEDGKPWDGEQCDSCGVSGYTIKLLPNLPANRITSWRVVCTRTDYADGYVEGCGAEYRLAWYKGAEVVW